VKIPTITTSWKLFSIKLTNLGLSTSASGFMFLSNEGVQQPVVYFDQVSVVQEQCGSFITGAGSTSGINSVLLGALVLLLFLL